MFVLMLGASLTFGVAVFTAAMYFEGALLALRTAAHIIGWLFVLATLAGLVGLRHASVGRVGAAMVALCAGAATLYMAHFLEWSEPVAVATRLAAVDTLPDRPVITLASYRTLQPPPAPLVGKSIPAPQPKLVAAARPAAARPTARAANECTTLSGVESLQCNRCSEKLGFARVTCHESVRLQYCETELGDERTCPSPIPQSYPG